MKISCMPYTYTYQRRMLFASGWILTISNALHMCVCVCSLYEWVACALHNSDSALEIVRAKKKIKVIRIKRIINRIFFSLAFAGLWLWEKKFSEAQFYNRIVYWIVAWSYYYSKWKYVQSETGASTAQHWLLQLIGRSRKTAKRIKRKKQWLA